MEVQSWLFLFATGITAVIAIFKNAKKGNILKAVIEGVEESAGHMSDSALQSVKKRIADKAIDAGLYKPLDKIVQVLTKKKSGNR